eukprot:5436505-Prymnesium_polylepis.1
MRRARLPPTPPALGRVTPALRAARRWLTCRRHDCTERRARHATAHRAAAGRPSLGVRHGHRRQGGASLAVGVGERDAAAREAARGRRERQVQRRLAGTVLGRAGGDGGRDDRE